jgi:hypothetical protein
VSEQKTIFEGLYQIDWSQGSLYETTAPYEIPNALRNLLSDDDSIYADAHIFLFSPPIRGPIELDEIRFHIVRFCLEILDLPITPAKVGILDFLQEVIRARNDVKLFRQNTTYVQSYTRIYNILEDHIPLFFKLLEDDDKSVCLESLALLTAFKNRFQTIVPHLMAQFECGNDLYAQMSLLKAIGTLLVDPQRFPDIKHCADERAELRKTFIPVFWHLAQTHPLKTVRCVAAQVGVRVAYNVSRDLADMPPYIAPLLIEAFLLVEVTGESDFRIKEKKESALSYIKLLPNAQDVLISLAQVRTISQEDVGLIMKQLSLPWATQKISLVDWARQKLSNAIQWIHFS